MEHGAMPALLPHMLLRRTGKFSVLELKSAPCGAAAAGSSPEARARLEACERMSEELGYEVTCDVLTTGIHVLQLRKGHRFSNDDLFTAWRASAAKPTAATLLDLGSGIGSVGLSTLAKMRGGASTLVGIEAQEISWKLACAAVTMQPHLRTRVRFLHGDLRNSDEVLAAQGLDQHYELVTGSPPYFPEESAIKSPLPQRAPCRIEMRGCVYEYAEAAARHLKPGVDARFAFVMLTNDPRTYDAPRRAGLAILEIWDYTFMSGRKPHISTLVCCLEGEAPDTPLKREHMLIRDKETGNFTEEHVAWKRFMLDSATA